MKRKAIYISGIGSYLPEKILTNADLEKIVETSDEWIRTRTGIQKRHLASPEQASSDLATEAVKRALKDAGIEAAEVDAILISSVTPDMGGFPSTASLVQRNLGLKSCPCMDVEAACAGLIYVLELAAAMINYGPYKTILCIGSDKLSAITDWTDRSTCVLFGDGASALVVTDREENARARLVDSFLGTDSTSVDILTYPAGGSRLPASEETVRQRLHTLHMQGPEVYKVSVKSMHDACAKILQQNNLKIGDISFCIPHQANLRIIEAVGKQLGCPLDRFVICIQETGNTSSGSIGIAMDRAYQEGRFQKGDYLLCVGFGAGMTYSSAILQWLK